MNTWPELADFQAEFLAQYPNSPYQDIHMSFLNGRIQLNILIGDVNDRIVSGIHQLVSESKVDAWYLDGFAPSKNPDMWTNELFQNLANNSHTNTRIATFTAAGFVRRGLIDAGFEMKKRKGFGHKREMLIGQLVTD